MKTFAQKLLACRAEDSPVGDLAADAFFDWQFPKKGSATQVHAYLLHRGACSDALRAFSKFCQRIGVADPSIDDDDDDDDFWSGGAA